MFCAISTRSVKAAETLGLPVDKAFLHRGTGEIVFIYENVGDAEAMVGKDAAIDGVFDRTHIDASPDEWLEIPKFASRFDGCGNEEAFIQRFLQEHGIEAELE
jgi:hypothetical protein